MKSKTASSKLDLVVIKTPEKVFVCQRDKINDNYSSNLTHYYINGKQQKESFKKSWIIMDSIPEKIQSRISGKQINHRYELIDDSMANDKIKKMVNREDIAVYDDDEYEWCWKSEYSHLRSLYTLKYDMTDDSFEDMEFDIEIILELDDELKPAKVNNSNAKIQTQLLDKLLFPSIYNECLKPVSISSVDLYKIIREHVKNNINPMNADITSDYDFCFTVEKKIHLQEPKIIKTEVKKGNGRSYSQPRFKTNTKKYLSKFKIFEMTHASKKYNDYPILPPLYANNIDELNNKLDNILDNLTKQINSKVEVCSHCNGQGFNDENVSKVNVNDLINGGK